MFSGDCCKALPFAFSRARASSSNREKSSMKELQAIRTTSDMQQSPSIEMDKKHYCHSIHTHMSTPNGLFMIACLTILNAHERQSAKNIRKAQMMIIIMALISFSCTHIHQQYNRSFCLIKNNNHIKIQRCCYQDHCHCRSFSHPLATLIS